jgi:hypothetical protein
LKPSNKEKFTEPIIDPSTITTPQISCPQATIAQLPISIVSRFFGIGFNIYPANNTTQATLPTNITNTNLFLIEHIPVVYNNTLGSMYAISSDGQLTIKLRNEQDPTQWWVLTSKSDNTSSYYIITPFTQNISTSMALQYENGNLALRPYTTPGFESQKWITSTTKITRGIPVLNYNPASMFTPEFDPYSTTTNINTTSLTQQNSQQVSDVLSAIKANIQQYLTQIGNTNQAASSTSSLGNQDAPLNINLNLGGSGSGSAGGSAGSGSIPGGSTLSAFANISGNASPSDILSLLDRYETTTGSATNADTLYSTNDLQSALNTTSGCSTVNIGDYTSNRVSSCNCKL